MQPNPLSRTVLLAATGAMSVAFVGCNGGKDEVSPDGFEEDSGGLAFQEEIDDSAPDGVPGSCDELAVATGNLVLSASNIGDFCDTSNAIEGDLTINGGGFADLEALSCLCSVSGILRVNGTEVTSLDGLDSLSSVSGLSMVDNPSLSDIQALGGLSELPDGVELVGSPELRNLVGLDDVSLAGPVTLEGLGITSMRGLGSLVTVGQLTLRDLPALANMEGAGALDFVDGGILIENTPEHTFEGLENIRRIRQAFVISNSEASLYGLENLATIGGSFIMEDVTRLESLEGISRLGEVGGHLKIDNAPMLNSLSGPSNLRNINGSLWLAQTNVGSLSGLTGIIAIGGLRLDTNPFLTSTAGLPPVIALDELVLHWNADLVDLTHLDTIRAVNGPLTISGHVALSELIELHGIESVDGDVNISNNVSLTNEDAQALIDAIGRDSITGEVYVSGNSG